MRQVLMHKEKQTSDRFLYIKYCVTAIFIFSWLFWAVGFSVSYFVYVQNIEITFVEIIFFLSFIAVFIINMMVLTIRFDGTIYYGKILFSWFPISLRKIEVVMKIITLSPGFLVKYDKGGWFPRYYIINTYYQEDHEIIMEMMENKKKLEERDHAPENLGGTLGSL